MRRTIPVPFLSWKGVRWGTPQSPAGAAQQWCDTEETWTIR